MNRRKERDSVALGTCSIEVSPSCKWKGGGGGVWSWEANPEGSLLLLSYTARPERSLSSK